MSYRQDAPPPEDTTEAALKGSRLKENSDWTLPNSASIAIWVVVNIEDFDLGYPIDGGESVPAYREYAIREYGNRAGMGRILAELDRFGIRGTGAVNGAFARSFPSWMKDCADRGWDMMGHGEFNNRKLHSYSPAEESEIIRSVLEDVESAWGERPKGWLSPGLQESRSTLSELAGRGIEYVADFVADDRPFEMAIAGKTLISVPYSLDINDKRAYEQEHLTPEGFKDRIVWQFDELRRDGQTAPTVMVIAIHPYLTGLPYRIQGLRGALEHLSQYDDIWWATGAEIAQRFRLRK